MQLDEQRLRFRDAMISLSIAVNIITTESDAGQRGIMATAICSVTDTPSSLMMCASANSTTNPVFQGNDKLCVNILGYEQELTARHLAGMTDMAMEEHFSLSCRRKGPLAQSMPRGPLAGLEGEIHDAQAIDAHLVYLVEIKDITLNAEGHEFIYFKRRLHPVMLKMGAAIQAPTPSRTYRKGISIVISITYPPDEQFLFNRLPPFLTAYIPKTATQLSTLLHTRVTPAASLQDSSQFTSSNAMQIQNDFGP